MALLRLAGVAPRVVTTVHGLRSARHPHARVCPCGHLTCTHPSLKAALRPSTSASVSHPSLPALPSRHVTISRASRHPVPSYLPPSPHPTSQPSSHNHRTTISYHPLFCHRLSSIYCCTGSHIHYLHTDPSVRRTSHAAPRILSDIVDRAEIPCPLPSSLFPAPSQSTPSLPSTPPLLSMHLVPTLLRLAVQVCRVRMQRRVFPLSRIPPPSAVCTLAIIRHS